MLGMATAPHGLTPMLKTEKAARAVIPNCLNLMKYMVGVIGFEPTAPASRTQCSTSLSYTPRVIFEEALT